MSTLQGTKIKDTYPGLIKIEDNGAVQPTVLKTLTDGTGGTLPLSVSQVETKFTSGSLVDFTGTTVTGLPGGGAAGLVAGTGTNSMRNADDLANGSTASAENTIALGNGAQAIALNCIALGQGAYANGTNALAIGQGATAENQRAVSVGDGITNQNGPNVTVGGGNNNYANGSHIVGTSNNMGLGNQRCTLIASNISVPAGQNDFVGIGRINNPSGSVSNTISMGLVSQVTNSQNSVNIGRSSFLSNASNSVAIGRGAGCQTGQSAAIGYNVVATRSNFVTVNELECKTVGGGIIIPSPDGTLYKITVANGGTLTVAAV